MSRTALPAGKSFALASLLVLSTVSARPLAGQQIVLQNDSVADFSQTAIQAGFVAGERAAAWLTSTCTGNVSSVRILWLSLTGGGGDTLGESISISRAGTYPAPGSLVVELFGPVLTDGFLNEIAVPPVAVATGETIVVDFRFLNNPPAIGPSIVTDVDGCQTGANGLFAIPPSIWFDACLLGVSGDFVIRAVVDCDSAAVFSDGFESGDTTAWSEVVP